MYKELIVVILSGFIVDEVDRL